VQILLHAATHEGLPFGTDADEAAVRYRPPTHIWLPKPEALILGALILRFVVRSHLCSPKLADFFRKLKRKARPSGWWSALIEIKH
jgi:hypothetical protein